MPLRLSPLMGWSGRCSCPASRRSWRRGAKDKEHAMSQTPNTAIAVIGIDVGKNSFHVVGRDVRGAIVLRQKWSRGQVEARLANVPPCLIGMEACVGAHHLSRAARQSLPARSVCAGGTGCPGQDQRRGTLWAQILDRSRQEAVAPQCAGDRARQQACPHRLGSAGERTRHRADADR
jgi:hypothetical protein